MEDSKGTKNKANLSAVGFAGMVLGILAFGVISDKVGRKPGMFITTAIIFVFMILMSASAGPTPQVLINCLIAFRFFLERLFVWATHFIIDVGFPAAWFVPLVLLWIFGLDHLRIVWRGAILLGAIPPLILAVLRLFMDEPEAYQKHSMKHVKIPYRLIIKRYWPKIVAVSFCWFIYDWITYPFGMFAGDITEGAIGTNPTLYQTLAWGCLINFFYVPGAFFGAWIADWLGPRYCMIFGSVMQAIFGFVLSAKYLYFKERTAGFAVMYGIFLSWGEVGPGNNVGLFAAKGSGPTAARAQLYSIAAASGKVGAFIGTHTFPYIRARFEQRSELLGETGIFWIGSVLALLSALVTFFFLPEIRPDYMVDEDRLFREYLVENGVDISMMGLNPDQVSIETVDDTADKTKQDEATVNVQEK